MFSCRKNCIELHFRMIKNLRRFEKFFCIFLIFQINKNIATGHQVSHGSLRKYRIKNKERARNRTDIRVYGIRKS